MKTQKDKDPVYRLTRQYLETALKQRTKDLEVLSEKLEIVIDYFEGYMPDIYRPSFYHAIDHLKSAYKIAKKYNDIPIRRT